MHRYMITTRTEPYQRKSGTDYRHAYAVALVDETGEMEGTLSPWFDERTAAENFRSNQLAADLMQDIPSTAWPLPEDPQVKP